MNQEDFEPPVPEEPGKISRFHRNHGESGKKKLPPSSYQAKKLRLRQGWADYFVEQADKHQSNVPSNYNQWVSALCAAAYFGDTLSNVKLRTELDRLKEKKEEFVPKTQAQQLRLAHFQLMGIGKSLNPEEAVTTYGKMVEETGNPKAQYALGMCYLDGIVVKENAKLGLEYLKKSMDQGYFLAKCQYTLAIFMEKGEYRDLHFCFSSFLEMANQGCAFACTIVGVFYQYGIVVNPDPRMAEGYMSHGEKEGFSIDRFGDDLSEVVEDLIFDYLDDFPLAEE